MTVTTRALRALVTGALMPLLMLLGLGACTDTGGPGGGERPASAASSAAGRTPLSASATGTRSPDEIPEVPASELPKEARDTLRLIDAGGPFPYRQDGTHFRNREGLLPRQKLGYYREYTVRTPGAQNRGARRIIGGTGGERYYTADHYRSFVRVTKG